MEWHCRVEKYYYIQRLRNQVIHMRRIANPPWQAEGIGLVDRPEFSWREARSIWPVIYGASPSRLLHAPMRSCPAFLGGSAPWSGLTPALTGTAQAHDRRRVADCNCRRLNGSQGGRCPGSNAPVRQGRRRFSPELVE